MTQTRRRRRRGVTLSAVAATVLTVTSAVFVAGVSPASAGTDTRPPLPVVIPAPQLMERSEAEVRVPRRARVLVDDSVDDQSRQIVVDVLRSAGAEFVDVVSSPATYDASALNVRVGLLSSQAVAADLAALGVSVPATMPAEGYLLGANESASRVDVVLGGVDADGVYYAAQTLRQLVVPMANNPDKKAIAGVRIKDYPVMPLRGTIEGFYGSPWTHDERVDQLSFYGDMKMNTYIYAPKDDAYHRDKWREPYPADALSRLAELVGTASNHHVDFTFALSPGVSICYSRPSDYEALIAKFQALYDLGVRSFSIPLDDISYTTWNCPEDLLTYGLPGRTAAAAAQVSLLNRVQHEFIETHAATKRLQMVPTEYGDITDSAYKQKLRADLDQDVVVMWTGTDTVPPKVTVAEAQRASELFGRKVFLWDNYPVNDYGNTEGRLLLAPYDKREPGLSNQLSGIVSNPMNQAAASKVAVATMADFSWNDHAYNRDRSWTQAARYLAGGDATTTDAMLTFFDLNHVAPTFGSTPWQPQAPGLARQVATFWTTWNAGARSDAISGIRPSADAIGAAPGQIRSGAADPMFLSDTGPWLDATALWGRAFDLHLDALDARIAGDVDGSNALLAEGRAVADQARAVTAPAGENRWNNLRVKIGDGVLDKLLSDIQGTLQNWS
ncbi:hypothetical protein C1I99_28395 [Micromonospora deserti]|uniref:GH84 domain-containing protein n=1 Tax=Micromonospora deserti TaxID=2070366 RepID=A0A2W2CF46_9ACTN|nr:hypothetical protein C1I99_28395 [Micromonospora deserti]